MDKIEFNVIAKEPVFARGYTLFFTNFYPLIQGCKHDKLDRKLHVHDGDRFKVTIQKVKA